MMKITLKFKHSLLFLFLTTMVTAQTWEPKTGLPGTTNGRHHPVVWSIGDYGYLLTGTKNSALANKDFFEYDAISDSWQQLPDFPGLARSFSIGAVYNDEGYIGFGMTGNGTMLNDLWKYNPDTETWTQLTSCPCTGRRHPTFTINETHGKLYVGKGDNAQFNMTDWWEYDIATDQWTQRQDFPGVHRHHPFHFSIGDYTYTGLGHGASIYSDLHRYNPADSSWLQMTSAPGVRVAGTQFTYDGMGFVLSGDGANHLPTNPSVFWGYKPDTDSWISLPPHPGTSRWAPGSFIINGTVYFTCGENGANSVLESDLWSFDLDNFLHVEEFEDVFTIYPNPTSGQVHIRSTQPLDNTTVKIYSMEGSIVYDRTFEETINIESLSTGIYVIEITRNAEVVSRSRIIKQ